MENKNISKKLNKKKKGNNYNMSNFFNIQKQLNSQSMRYENLEFDNDELYKKLIKKQKKEKRQKKRELEKVLTKDKFSKKIISVRKATIKKQNQKEKIENKRVKKANKYLLVEDDEEREIYLKIDEFNNNGKKTIVYFIDSFFPVIDGVVSVLDNYAKQMKEDYNVVVCAPKHKNSCYKIQEYFVLYADSMFIKKQGYDLAFPQFDYEFQKYISLLKIDLIHLQSPFNMGSFGLSLAKKRKVPCLITFHSQFKQNFYNAVKNDIIASWLTKSLMTTYQKADVVITMNNFAKKIMAEYGLKKQVEIIPNATNLKTKVFDAEYEKKIINKFKINTDTFNIIFIGRFVEVKNVYFILDVIEELYKINKNFNFIFLGYGPEQGRMQKFCQQNGLNDIVKFTGKIDNLDEKAVIIKNSNLLFFPSVYDTDGIVKIECACYSVPTLCIENTGVSSNMINNQNGFIEKHDKFAFVNKLDFLIKNVDFVKKIGKNANLEIYTTWEQTCEKLKILYEKCLKSYNFKYAKNNKNKTAKKR